MKTKPTYFQMKFDYQKEEQPKFKTKRLLTCKKNSNYDHKRFITETSEVDKQYRKVSTDLQLEQKDIIILNYKAAQPIPTLNKFITTNNQFYNTLIRQKKNVRRLKVSQFRFKSLSKKNQFNNQNLILTQSHFDISNSNYSESSIKKCRKSASGSKQKKIYNTISNIKNENKKIKNTDIYQKFDTRSSEKHPIQSLDEYINLEKIYNQKYNKFNTRNWKLKPTELKKDLFAYNQDEIQPWLNFHNQQM